MAVTQDDERDPGGEVVSSVSSGTTETVALSRTGGLYAERLAAVRDFDVPGGSLRPEANIPRQHPTAPGGHGTSSRKERREHQRRPKIGVMLRSGIRTGPVCRRTDEDSARPSTLIRRRAEFFVDEAAVRTGLALACELGDRRRATEPGVHLSPEVLVSRHSSNAYPTRGLLKDTRTPRRNSCRSVIAADMTSSSKLATSRHRRRGVPRVSESRRDRHRGDRRRPPLMLGSRGS